jgi:hypothetical protein
MKTTNSKRSPGSGGPDIKKKIAIVGAGQAGLQLGMSLLGDERNEVTLYSDRTAAEIASGSLMATAILFQNKRKIEADLGLDLWSEKGKEVSGIEIEIRDESSELALGFDAPFTDGPGMALDYRLKFPEWMDEFERRGGNLVIRKTGIDELEQLAAASDLVVVAAGKGGLSKVFERDPDRSPPYSAPMRHITAVVIDRDLELDNMAISIVPGGAEIVLLPILAGTGKRSTAILVFARDGSSFKERYAKIENGDDALKLAVGCARLYCPQHAEALEGAQLADERSFLYGAFTPTVRKPVGRLPSGAIVLGASDCLTLVDPICGNGLNNAVVMTDIYARHIAAKEDANFDETWMNMVFDEFWEYGKDVFVFMRTLLEQPDHFCAALEPASQNGGLASDIVNGYTDPGAFATQFGGEASTRAHVRARLEEAEIRRPATMFPAVPFGVGAI